ncbi:MAG: acyl--CoA ligase [Spirochaetales bacterium]|nr:acyl--CoA ligase [Spirochaetales bacterium]
MVKKYAGLNVILETWAEKTPDKEAAVIEGERITFGQLQDTAKKIASSLYAAGIRKKDRVGIIFPNSITWYTCYWGIIKIGAIPVPFSPQLGEYEMIELFHRTGIRLCFTCREFRGNNHYEQIKKHFPGFMDLKMLVVNDVCKENGNIISLNNFISGYSGNIDEYDMQLLPNDPLMLVCSSGTTGKPKIILVEHEGFLKSAMDMSDYLGFTSKEIMLLGMPLYHQGGFGMGLQSLVKGGKVIFQEKFIPLEFLRLIHEEQATVIQLSATLAKILCSVPDFESYDLSSVKMCYFAGELLPDMLASVFYDTLGKRVINLIGSSETASMQVWDSETDRGFPANDFKPLPFTEVKVLNDDGKECSEGEVGVINVFTDAVLREYFKNEQETKKRIKIIDGKRWFDTGDLGKVLPKGRVRFAGRKKRIIKRGSNLIYPEEIESFLLTHPAIEAIAVVGREDNIFGERTVAYIQVKEDAGVNYGNLLRYCKGKLSAYKIPDEFIIMSEIPKDIGKIQYKKIREQEEE